MSQRACNSSSNKFCYICGQYLTEKQQLNITELVKHSYELYFGLEITNWEKYWVPNVICSCCSKGLIRWSRTGRSLRFSKPMIWREPADHIKDCYFCVNQVNGFNSKNKASIEYEYVQSVTKPEPSPSNHFVQHPYPKINSSGAPKVVAPKIKHENRMSWIANKLDQEELNDWIRDLDLPKTAAEILGSRLAEKNFLQDGTSTSCYRNRELEFRPFFLKLTDLLYCTDVQGLIEMYDIEYNSKDWRLFIDRVTTQWQ